MSSSVTDSSTSPFCCCWSRSTSASGRRKASLPSCILICSSQTLARLKCRLFAGDWHAARAAADSFDWSPSHQMNACVSRRSFTRRDRARTHQEAAYRNPAPLPMLPRADPRAVRSLMFQRQYCLASRAWQRGKQGVAPSAPSVVHLQRLQFRPVCPRAKGNTAAAQPTRARLASMTTLDAGTNRVQSRAVSNWRRLVNREILGLVLTRNLLA
jgi:hypothetical protein